MVGKPKNHISQRIWRHAIYASLINLCISFFSDKNLAVEGEAFQKSLYWEYRNKMSRAIDGNFDRRYYSHVCPSSYSRKKLWLRVEFHRLIEVYAVKYFRGKYEVYSIDTGFSDVNENNEYNEVIWFPWGKLLLNRDKSQWSF